MSEKEFASQLNNERNAIAKRREQLDRDEFQLDQTEKFGKYDITVPGEGEETYQSYLAKRPAEGIVRNGDSLYHTKTGQFASTDEYLSDKSAQATADYYYQLMNTDHEVQPEVDYDAMGLKQLVVAMARAERVGDRALSMEIQNIMEQKLDQHVETEGWKTGQKEEQLDILLSQVLALSGNSETNNRPVDATPEVTSPSEAGDTPDEAEETQKAEVSEGKSVTATEKPSENTEEPVVVAGDERFAQSANDGETLEEYEARNNRSDTSADSDAEKARIAAMRAEVDDLSDLQIGTREQREGLDEGKRSIWSRVKNGMHNLYSRSDLSESERAKRRDDFRHPIAYISGRFTERANRLHDYMHDEERDKNKQRLLLGAAIGVAALAAAYIFRDQISDAATSIFGGGSAADHANTVSTTIGHQGSIHDLDKFRTGHAGPGIVTGAEAPILQLHTPEASLYANAEPWDWAKAAFGPTAAEATLHHLSDLAQAHGHTVEWLPTADGHEYVKVDGISETTYVIDTFRPYAG